MIFGYTPSVTLLTVLGVLAFSGLVFQLLLGKRVIKFEGRTHLKVHRWVAYFVTAIAGIHGLLALVRANLWNIG